ncbi:hypothetical protein GCM10023194_31470 [Planotetraspora phitsanulokensis]|uniref:DUF998 domain-containing protein n=1 Tax=Planotetraspora phitsanulokensis TaxID=575192 RepID=A0A8J3UAW5_9ACTN|nr:hypothetical protein [Planotetraspora phitsanulokensis]GII35715.1 hypothetical protein Pph01_07180 [Planotetraspora phitsanulokensis]
MHHSSRARVFGAVGIAGALFSLAGWPFMLGDPADRTASWYIGNTLGDITCFSVAVLTTGLFLLKEAGPGLPSRITLALWSVCWMLLGIGGIIMLTTGQDNLLLPIGGLGSALVALVAGILIARRADLPGGRRWAPLVYGVGGFLLTFAQSDRHDLLTNIVDLATNLLLLGVGIALFAGARERQTASSTAPASAG